MTPQPQQPNPNELLLITREELDRCCSQLSAAGYKVSANYVEAMVLSRPAQSSCIWIEDEDGNWHTDCGQIHQFTNGTPKENHYGYCPYCGKSLRTGGEP